MSTTWDDSEIWDDDDTWTESDPSSVLTGVFSFKASSATSGNNSLNSEITFSTVSIFGQKIDEPRFYGITLTSRELEEEEIFIGSSIQTMTEYIEYEYEVKFQWIDEDTKDLLIDYIKENSGKEVYVELSLFSVFEGGTTETIDFIEYAKIIPDYSSTSLTPQKNNMFDLAVTCKAREIYEIT